MIDIAKLHIHYRLLPKGKETKGLHKFKVVKPTDPKSTMEIKHDIARVVETIRNKAEYYYVVVEIDRDGEPAFRTVVPKTFFHEKRT